MLTPCDKKPPTLPLGLMRHAFFGTKAVVYDFSPSRAGEHERNFLGQWMAIWFWDDCAGYKASIQQVITEIGSMAHAFRPARNEQKPSGEQELHSVGGLYEIERQAR